MSGQSFEFTPGGIVAKRADGIVAEGADAFSDTSVLPAFVPHVPPPRPDGPRPRGKPIDVDGQPPNVMKIARARLRFLDREIARLKKLEAERDELRRLLDAAANKPRAVVRDITAAKRG